METSSPLRARLLADLGDPESDRASLDGFMAIEDVGEALRAWFGDEVLGKLRDLDQVRRLLDRDVAEIDDVLTVSCNALLHHPKFLALEAAWRGVFWLTGSLSADGQTRLRLLDCRWPELARDLERAADFDQSALFDLIYNQEFGMPGGIPYALLIGLYEVQHRPTRDHPTDDVAVLRRMSAVAAGAFSPILLGVRPIMVGAETFGDLERRPSLAAVFRGQEYSRFNAFRGLSDSRFVGLVCPRVLLRAPYRGRQAGDCGFRFTETVDEAGAHQVWGVGALAMAHICLRAFNDYRWLAAIRGTVQDELAGGVIIDLATPEFETDAPGAALKFPLEINLTEALDRDLSEAGFICIRRCKDTPFASISNLPSAHRPKGAYLSEIARVNEQLGAMLNYVLCVARFAHYIKVMARDWIGSFKTPEDCERRLSSWIGGYCSVGDDMSYELRARFPLESARVRVQQVAGAPGSLECTVHLKPHLQLDQAISEFQLVTMVQGVERQL